MENLEDHTLQEPEGRIQNIPRAPLTTEAENEIPGRSFWVWDIIKLDSWDSDMFSTFCFPALVMVLFLKDPDWMVKFVWAMIVGLIITSGKQALQVLRELWTAWRCSQQLASVLEGRTFAFPFSLLAFIVTAYIGDAVWKQRFLWAVMNLVVVHLTVRAHLEPIERGLESVLNDFLLELLSQYMPSSPRAMQGAEALNEGSTTSFGVLRVPLFYLAFHSMEYYSHDLKDRHMWAMVLVFTFYGGRQALALIHELLAAVRSSQPCAPADSQSCGTGFGVLEVVRSWMGEHSRNRGFLALRALDVPLSLVAFITMAMVGDGCWKDRCLGALMSTLWVSTMFQLVHMCLAILAVLHYLKQRGSRLTSLSSDVPSRSLTASAGTTVDSTGTSTDFTFAVPSMDMIDPSTSSGL